MRQRAEQLAATLPPLLVAAQRVASTVAQGVHGRRRVGQGETFWQFRPYAPGDPAKAIDWRQSAKTDRAFVRETEWEAAQSVWLWRDGSASMAYRSARSLPLKRERAELLLLALTVLLIGAGEHVAALGHGIPPATGRVALGRLAHVIEQPVAAAASGLPGFEPLPRHAELVLIGDFLAPLEEMRQLISRFLGRGVRGYILQVLDPAEETLPFAGRVRFEGLEGEDPALVPRVESVRSDYVSRMSEHQAGLAELARAAGWYYGMHHTDRTPERGLLSLYAALARLPIN
ncbi:MAG: DUF58 domain-containing protein [Proteobacteria bacterium]|nr:DUF58 domain-containing protein [Pseudomonadota bacterium]MBI3497592.1 DUF58 domain-containing protein [Pseudomonadota bacterium]